MQFIVSYNNFFGGHNGGSPACVSKGLLQTTFVFLTGRFNVYACKAQCHSGIHICGLHKIDEMAYIPKKYFPAGFANAEVEAQLLVHQILILLFVAFPEAATRWYNGSAEVLTCL